MKAAVASLLDACRSREPTGECPMIEALEGLEEE
jgi:hypothetical protein